MINSSILLWWLCLVVIDASPVTTPDTREVPHLQSACTRMDVWGFSKVAKALCDAVGTCVKSQGRLVCRCSRCAPGAGGGIGCTLSGKKWYQQPSKRKQRLTLKKLFFFHPQQYFLQEFAVNHLLLRPHFLKKDDLSNWSPSREELRRIRGINTLVPALLRQDYF